MTRGRDSRNFCAVFVHLVKTGVGLQRTDSRRGRGGNAPRNLHLQPLGLSGDAEKREGRRYRINFRFNMMREESPEFEGEVGVESGGVFFIDVADELHVPELPLRGLERQIFVAEIAFRLQLSKRVPARLLITVVSNNEQGRRV